MSKDFRLVELGHNLLSLRLKKSEIELEEMRIKDEIADILREEGVAEKVVPLDELHVMAFKNNYRYTKSFDKDGLAAKTGRDRDELDYQGVSALVEKQVVTSKVVGQYLSENKSEFVTVRKRKVDKKKK